MGLLKSVRKLFMCATTALVVGTSILPVDSVHAQGNFFDAACDPDAGRPIFGSEVGTGEAGDWLQEGTANFERAKYLYLGLLARGLNSAGAAGALGSGAQESGGTFHPAVGEDTMGTVSIDPEVYFPGYKRMPEIGYGVYVPSARDVKGVLGEQVAPGVEGAGGYGIFQITPGQRIFEEGHPDGKHWSSFSDRGFEYSEAFGTIQDPDWEQNLLDPKRVAAAIDDELDYIFISHKGAGMTHLGLKETMLNNEKAFNNLANAKTPAEGAYHWFYFVENGMSLATYYGNEFAVGKRRDENAEKAYEKFYNMGPEFQVDSVDRTFIEAVKAKGGNRVRKVNGIPCKKQEEDLTGDILELAKSLVGYWCYSNERRRSVIEYIDNVPPSKDVAATDCTGFVYFVLKKAGYKVPDDMWYTGVIDKDLSGPQEYLTRVTADEAKAGDVMNFHDWSCPQDGGCLAHAAILAEDFHGPSTKTYEMGGITNSHGHGGCDAVDGPDQGATAATVGGGNASDDRVKFGRPIKK